mmetsp:Transcript_30090/g.41940  ORF Transcript_30090/g.41940 Transcript_30090/m.41940 type:complete len:90 (+) Transcript_30090:747-1016(+)
METLDGVDKAFIQLRKMHARAATMRWFTDMNSEMLNKHRASSRPRYCPGQTTICSATQDEQLGRIKMRKCKARKYASPRRYVPSIIEIC